MNISHTSPEQVEVYRLNLPAAVIITLLALFLQSFIPHWISWFAIFDLPLLVTIFFGVTRRNPVSGLLTGCAIGLLQDSLVHQPFGVYGITKTVVGYFASSLGVKLDVENAAARLILTFVFFVLHKALYFGVARYMVGQVLEWSWGHELTAGLANGVFAVGLFFVLDRFKHRI